MFRGPSWREYLLIGILQNLWNVLLMSLWIVEVLETEHFIQQTQRRQA
jgi:hypothetical protein